MSDIERRNIPDPPKLSDDEVLFPDREEVDAPPMPKIRFTPIQWIGKQWRKIKRMGIKQKVLGIVVALGSTYFLGIDLSPLLELIEPYTQNEQQMNDLISNLDFSTTESIVLSVLLIATVGGSFALNYFQKTKWLGVLGQIKEAVEIFKNVRALDSEDGEAISANERKQLVAEGIDIIEEALKGFGIDIDLDGDGN